MIAKVEHTAMNDRPVGGPWMQALLAQPTRHGAVPMTVLVGPSGGGKSTAARYLARVTGAAVVHQDEFLIPREERRGPDLLAKFDRTEFERVVARLLVGRWAEFTPFDPIERRRVGRRVVEPAARLIVEGIVALFCPLVRFEASARIYVDAPVAMREQRQIERLDREGQYRGVPREEVLAAIAAKKITEDPIVRRQFGFCQWLLDTADLIAIPVPVEAVGDHWPTAA